MRRVKTIIILILTVFLTATSGCWDRREIENIGFVLMVGIDRATQDKDQLELTVHIAKPFAIAGGTTGAVIQERPFWLVSSTGSTVFEAVRNFQSQSPRLLYWAHNKFVGFGAEYARGGIRESLDWFMREGQTRLLSNIVISKEERISSLLEGEFELERLPSQGGLGIIMAAEEGLSTIVNYTLKDFLVMLETEGQEAVAARAEVVPRPQEGDLRGDLKRDKISQSVRITGAAVFKGDRLAGWLNKPETRGLLWIKGEVKSGIIVIKHPKVPDKYLSLEILRADGKSEVKPVGDKIAVKVTVDAEANLGDTQEFTDPLNEPGTWAVMERRMTAVIRNEIEAVLKKAQQEFNSDIFGFGASVHRKHPDKWKKIKKRWDEIFPEIKVETEIRAKLRRPGLSIRSVNIR